MRIDYIIAGGPADKLTPEQIRAIIGPEKLGRIKQQQAAPYFRAFGIAHEGVANPLVVGKDKVRKAIRWTANAIKTMISRPLTTLVKGLHKFKIESGRYTFAGDAPVIANEVARTQIEINGNLSEVGIFLAEPGRDDDLKAICGVSMEANWEMEHNGNELTARGLKKLHRVSGWAPADGGNETPAFPGGVAVGELAASGGASGELMLIAAGPEEKWTPAEFLAELNDAQKNELTEHLGAVKKPPEDRKEDRMKFHVELDQSGNVIDTDLPFTAVQGLNKHYKAYISQIFPDITAIIGQEVESFDENGVKTKIREGGDTAIRKAIMDEMIRPAVTEAKKAYETANAELEANKKLLAEFEAAASEERMAKYRDVIVSDMKKLATDAGYDEKALIAMDLTLKNGTLKVLPDDLDVNKIMYSGENGERKLLPVSEVEKLAADAAKTVAPARLKHFRDEIYKPLFNEDIQEPEKKQPDYALHDSPSPAARSQQRTGDIGV